ncbi:MAG: FAD-dependent oxidoreductase [Candidatus Omnitrophica bacterium]|nr:FAD-dependent oxidoreductase [Candidatus Omnitrophota bacterium]
MPGGKNTEEQPHQDDKPGGILRYGIPDFKLEKWILDRRLKLWQAEDVVFRTNVSVAEDIGAEPLTSQFNTICLTGGCRKPRDLSIMGRSLSGIHFAMKYLIQANRRVAGQKIPPEEWIDAKGKQVVVIGGGDTGADCVGTANRHGASRVIQIELLPKPPHTRAASDLWPDYPSILRTSSSHEEGVRREWSVQTKRFVGEKGQVKRLSCVRLDSGEAFEIEADLVLLALGFLAPERAGLLEDLRVELDSRGNVKTDENHKTSVKNVFAAGDMRRGQSLVVHALRDGRQAAHSIDRFLQGTTQLPLL